MTPTNPKQNDRNALIVGGIILMIIFYFAFFVMPTQKDIKNLRGQISKYESDTAKLKKSIEEYRKTAPKTDKKFEGSLSAFVEKKAREIDFKIAYIRPYGKENEGVEIKVDEMDGKTLLRFVYEMENNGVIVQTLNMRDYRGTGTWVVKMTLKT